MTSNTQNPPTPFVLIVAANQRLLLHKHYAFNRTQLNKLLARRTGTRELFTGHHVRSWRVRG